MSRTNKYTIDEKIDRVRQVLDHHQSIHSISKQYQLSESTLKIYGIDVMEPVRAHGYTFYVESPAGLL